MTKRGWIPSVGALLLLTLGCGQGTKSTEPTPSTASTDAARSELEVNSDPTPALRPSSPLVYAERGRAVSAHDCEQQSQGIELGALRAETAVVALAENGAYILAEDSEGWALRRVQGVMGEGACAFIGDETFGEAGRLSLTNQPLDVVAAGRHLLVLGQEPTVYSLAGESLYTCEAARNVTRATVGAELIGRHANGSLVNLRLSDDSCEATTVWSDDHLQATNVIGQSREGTVAFIAAGAGQAPALVVVEGESTRFFDVGDDEAAVPLAQVSSLVVNDGGIVLSLGSHQRLAWVSLAGEVQHIASMRDNLGTDRFFVPLRLAKGVGEGFFVTGWVHGEGDARPAKIYAFEAPAL